MDSTKTITLKKPVTLGSNTYEKLELREPTAAEALKARRETDALASDIVMIAEVSGVPKAAIERMGISDILEAARWLGNFFEAPAIGNSGSPS